VEKRWKAVLWETPRTIEVRPMSEAHLKKYFSPTPIDTVLLTKKCYSTAEDIFFNERNWGTQDRGHLHIEIEELPRIVETGA